jgi:hypothetical protein
MRIARMQSGLLLVMAVCLTPIALTYGAAPGGSLPLLFGIDASGVETRHIFRAMMGFYFALIVFWGLGALRPSLRQPALWSLFVFTVGLSFGRALSLAFDGWPGPLLFAYWLAEIAIAAASGWLLQRAPDPARPAGVAPEAPATTKPHQEIRS